MKDIKNFFSCDKENKERSDSAFTFVHPTVMKWQHAKEQKGQNSQEESCYDSDSDSSQRWELVQSVKERRSLRIKEKVKRSQAEQHKQNIQQRQME